MTKSNLKISCWIGNAPNHFALVNKIDSTFGVDSIIIDKKENRKRKPSLWEKIKNKIQFSSIHSGWKAMQAEMQSNSSLPKCSILKTNTVNSKEAVEFVKNNKPDLVIVSGTSLIKKKMLSIQPKLGILNLHTGLSPYVKGGPNCTNWCLVNHKPYLIGNTIMWIDSGIDTGNLICTEKTDLSEIHTFQELHVHVMNHAHDLYLRAIESVLNGDPNNVPQKKIGKGKTYYTKNWNAERKKELKAIIKKKDFHRFLQKKSPRKIKTVSL